MEGSMFKVFYSWQKDVSPSTNRTLIKNALTNAISNLKAKGIDAQIDEATRDAIGAVHIANSLFDKIDGCTAFVGDISIVGRYTSKKSTANPNVLVELGYAAKLHGWDNITLIFNSAFGDEDEEADPKALLPFDIGFRR